MITKQLIFESLRTTALLLLSSISLTCNADLFSPGVWLEPDEGEFILKTWTEPGQSGSGAYFWMTINDKNSTATLKVTDHTLGISQAWYLLAEDSAFDANHALIADPFFESINFSGTETLEIPRETPFYLGAQLTMGKSETFAWAKLTWNGTDLNLLDSAAENSGAGIFAGRHEVIPEPASVALFLSGGIGVWLLRKKKMR